MTGKTLRVAADVCLCREDLGAAYDEAMQAAALVAEDAGNDALRSRALLFGAALAERLHDFAEALARFNALPAGEQRAACRRLGRARAGDAPPVATP